MRKYIFSFLLFLVLAVSCTPEQGEGGGEDIIALDTPAGLKVDGFTDNSVKVCWDAVDKAQEYSYKLVARYISHTERADSVVALGRTPGLYKTIWDLDPDCVQHGFRYLFSVCAVAGRSRSDYSAYLEVEPGGFTPEMPLNVRLAGYTDNGLTYSWEGSDKAQQYEYVLYNASDEVVYSDFCRAESVTFDGLRKGRYYYFSVRALSETKSSLYSESVEGLTAGRYIPSLVFSATCEDFVRINPAYRMSVYDGTDYATYVANGTEGAYVSYEIASEYDPDPDAGLYRVCVPDKIDGMILPSSYIFSNNIFDSLPLWGESENTSVKLKSYQGVLSVNMTSELSMPVSKIILQADRDISGEVVSHSQHDSPALTLRGGREITISMKEKPVLGQQALAVYFPLPDGEYQSVRVLVSCDGFDTEELVIDNVSIASNAVTEISVKVKSKEKEPDPISADDINQDNTYENTIE